MWRQVCNLPVESASYKLAATKSYSLLRTAIASRSLATGRVSNRRAARSYSPSTVTRDTALRSAESWRRIALPALRSVNFNGRP
jgi:hypothetical protein